MNAMTPPQLRILYHHRIAASDGMRVHVAGLVQALRAQGHLVRLVGPGGVEVEQAAGAPGRLERVIDGLRRRLPQWAFESLELLYNAPAYARLSAAARDFRPDVIYERYNLFLLAGLWLRARRRLPMLLEINSPLAAERKALGQLRLVGVGERCERALWRGADAVLPVTGVLAGMVGQKRQDAASIHVVPNGADLAVSPDEDAAVAARERLGLTADAVVLGFVGFVRAWHGVGWALEALPHLPPTTHLVIVGDGPALAGLRTRAEELGLTARLHLVGRVRHDEVSAYMRTFDIALQTASVAYASPLKLFEYMALGRAVIAPDQPNIREVLDDGVNALLFDPDSEMSFRMMLTRLCDDAALRAQLGARARMTIEERRLTWAHNAERIGRLSRDLLDGADAKRRHASGANRA
ncbi:glycosyltransferase family 4 protein [Caulobacter segnis]